MFPMFNGRVSFPCLMTGYMFSGRVSFPCLMGGIFSMFNDRLHVKWASIFSMFNGGVSLALFWQVTGEKYLWPYFDR